MKPLLRNPFLTRPIKWGEPFCNREKELQTLIREAENSGLVVLYGPRRCGKTSILNQLEGRLGKDWIRIELDFTFVPNLRELVIRLDEILTKALPKSKKIRKALAAKKVSLELSFDPVTMMPSFGLGLKSKEAGSLIAESLIRLELLISLPEFIDRRVLVTFDEFQEIVYAPDNKDHIYEKLFRGVFQKRPEGFSVVFCGSKNTVLRKMFSDRARMFYRGIKSLDINSLQEDFFIPFAEENFSRTLGIDIPKVIPEVVCRFLDGHPYGLQKVMHNLWNLCDTEKTSGIDWPEALGIALRDFLLEELLPFQAHIGQLTPVQRKTFQAISGMEDEYQSIFSKESLGKIGLAQSTIALSLKALDEKGFLTKVPEIGHDRYVVTDIIDKLCLRILSGVSVDEMTDRVILAVRNGR